MNVLSKSALSSTASDQMDYPQQHRLFDEVLACSHVREKRLLAASCSSFHPHVSAQLALEGSMRKFILGTYMIICSENSNLFEIGKKNMSGTLFEDLSMFHCCLRY